MGENNVEIYKIKKRKNHENNSKKRSEINKKFNIATITITTTNIATITITTTNTTTITTTTLIIIILLLQILLLLFSKYFY